MDPPGSVPPGLKSKTRPTEIGLDDPLYFVSAGFARLSSNRLFSRTEQICW